MLEFPRGQAFSGFSQIIFSRVATLVATGKPFEAAGAAFYPWRIEIRVFVCLLIGLSFCVYEFPIVV
ncbi:hypothetical protein DVH24_009096 [Malus domestica]|uniref:Uncharacterized protein n=1 Tax=Malus domestica TaxID=3750 RepID=A0A498JSR5_MALDO|nr:hypothetical protein DVH24_009096 [Malus domestica]